MIALTAHHVILEPTNITTATGKPVVLVDRVLHVVTEVTQ